MNACIKPSPALNLSALVAALLVAGCAATGDGTTAVTVTDPNRLTQSGFLTQYDRLEPTPWGTGIECWRDPGLDARRYDKALIARILLSIKPADNNEDEVVIDPSDLKSLTDYFHDALVKALEPQMRVVTEAEDGTLVIRIALTRLAPTQVARSVSGTLIPYGFVAEAGSGVATGRPAGSTPYLGETGMEMQFVDAGSGAVVGECRDTQIGRKYASELESGATGAAQTWASGYVNSFQAWSYAKNAFDQWSLRVAERLAHLRGVSAEK